MLSIPVIADIFSGYTNVNYVKKLLDNTFYFCFFYFSSHDWVDIEVRIQLCSFLYYISTVYFIYVKVNKNNVFKKLLSVSPRYFMVAGLREE